jgi:hypothetical protein
MPSKRDFLTPAVRSIIRPFLVDRGFAAKTPRRYLRRQGDIVQAVWIEKSTWGSGAFDLTVCSKTLFDPLGLDGFVAVRRLTSPDWFASTATEAAEHVPSALGELKTAGLEFFSNTDSVQKLGEMLARDVTNPAVFTRAICEVWLGNVARARHLLLSIVHPAEERFLNSWWTERASPARKLLAAIDKGTALELLQRAQAKNERLLESSLRGRG